MRRSKVIDNIVNVVRFRKSPDAIRAKFKQIIFIFLDCSRALIRIYSKHLYKGSEDLNNEKSCL